MVRDLCGSVAEFEDEVGDNFVEDSYCFGEWFERVGSCGAGVTVGEEEKSDYFVLVNFL